MIFSFLLTSVLFYGIMDKDKLYLTNLRLDLSFRPYTYVCFDNPCDLSPSAGYKLIVAPCMDMNSTPRIILNGKHHATPP